jgi:uncharacterized protein (DUF924 family)
MMHTDVLMFWFTEIDTALWWKKDKEFDLLIKHRFGEVHAKAKVGELFNWRGTAEGSLAEVIVLDQFSRHIYRNHPNSFANDPLALVLAQTAISKGYDLQLPQLQRSFLYLPFMHSESAVIHNEAVKLYESLGRPVDLDFELRHKVIIDRFGRYPHRNEILGRRSTVDEIAFLKRPNSNF